MSDAYQLPPLRVPSGISEDQRQFFQALIQWVQLREGQQGNGEERVVLRRDLQTLGLAPAGDTNIFLQQASHNGVPTGRLNIQAITPEFAAQLTQQILNSRLFRVMMAGINDEKRFDEFDARIREILLKGIAAEAEERGADIRRMDEKVQDIGKSQAIALQEVSAGLRQAVSGVRTLQAATATAGRATAISVTQLQARLNAFDGGTATVEQVMSAVADAIDGLSAQYVLKVAAGGAIAGIGLSATDNGAGNATSAVIIRADKFAVVGPGYAGGLDTTPDAANIPFLIDGTTGAVVIHGSLFVDGSVTASKLFIAALSAITADLGTITAGILRNSTDSVRMDLGATGTSTLFRAGALQDYGAPYGNHYPVEIHADGKTFLGSDTYIAGKFTATAINAVDSLNIAGNAVTIPISTSGGSGSLTGTGAVTLATLPNYTSKGGQVVIQFGGIATVDNTVTGTFYVRRNGTAIFSWAPTITTGIVTFPPVVDVPGAGVSVTYTVTYEMTSTDGLGGAITGIAAFALETIR